ncbi:MAG: SDR family oxidoreductase [Planctomycetota bacterium]|jgi:NAD(P)-dependent dehydrogenase (short-subunit alcohol dehydrogenase family)
MPDFRTVLITGASTGIGRACARRLDDAGWTVFAGVRREQDGRTLDAGSSERLRPVVLDVTRSETIAAAAAGVADVVGRRGLDGLVNNAGIGVGGPLEFLDLGDLRRQFEVNTFGAVAVTQALLPFLRRARGRIVNMSSISGRFSYPFLGPYAASKFALEALSDALRLEVRRHGVRVSIVEPGCIETPIWDKARERAGQLRATLPAEAFEVYEGLETALARTIELGAARCIPADAVAERVEHALTARRPRVRYPVGADARIGTLLARVLPDRLRDWLVARELRRLTGG